MGKSRRQQQQQQQPRVRSGDRRQMEAPINDGRRTLQQPRTSGPRTQSPDRFGTNPAPGESHVHVPPELINPRGGDGGYLDGFEETMFA
jgi:hypothetical protein